MLYLLAFALGAISAIILLGFARTAKDEDESADRWVKRLDLIRDTAVGMNTEKVVSSGEQQWSIAYETVVDLRRRYDDLLRRSLGIPDHGTETLHPGNRTVVSPPHQAEGP